MIDPLFFTANMKVWKEFSPEDQKLILSCAAEAEKYGKALSRLSNDNGQATNTSRASTSSPLLPIRRKNSRKTA